MNKSLCRFIGHRYDPIGAEYYCVYYCERCGHEDYERGALGWLDGKMWRFGQWLKDRWWMFGVWRKCSECGMRWGRHDDEFDHIPF